MKIDLIYLITMLITLPFMVIQIRYMLYSKKFSTRGEKSSQLFSEMLPHDLAIMGMTFGFAAALISYRDRLAFGITSFQVVVLMLSFIPLFFISAISIIKDNRVRMFLGTMAYLIGAGGFGYLIMWLPHR